MNATMSAVFLSVLLSAGTAHAATPASGELNDETLSLAWDGAGPYVVPNVTPVNGAATVVCDPTVPPLCDEYVINVNLSDEFRALPENQRGSVKIGIEFPVTAGVEDYDLYLRDSAGAAMGESATSGQEAIVVPLKTLKNGSYTVVVVPFTPMATNYTGYVEIAGSGAKSAAGNFGGSLGGSLLALLVLAGLARRRVC